MVFEVSLPDLAEGVIPFETPETASPFLPQPTNTAQLEDPQPPASPFDFESFQNTAPLAPPVDDSTTLDPGHPSTPPHPSPGHPVGAGETLPTQTQQHLYTSNVLEPLPLGTQDMDMADPLLFTAVAGGLDRPLQQQQRQAQRRAGGFQAAQPLRLVMPLTPSSTQIGRAHV